MLAVPFSKAFSGTVVQNRRAGFEAASMNEYNLFLANRQLSLHNLFSIFCSILEHLLHYIGVNLDKVIIQYYNYVSGRRFSKKEDDYEHRKKRIQHKA